MFIVDSGTPNLLGNSGDLLVTGTADDPFYVHSPNPVSNRSAYSSNISSEYTLGSGVSSNADSATGDSTQLCHINASPKPVLKDTHPTDSIINKSQDGNNTNYATSSTSTPTAVPSVGRNRGEYYRHKFLLKLRKKQFNNNFDLGLYFLIKFGGPNTTMGLSILNDDELLECSEISHLQGFREVEEWYSNQYKSLLGQFNKMNTYNRYDKVDKHNGVNGGFQSQKNYGFNSENPVELQFDKPTMMPNSGLNYPYSKYLPNPYNSVLNKMPPGKLNKKLSKLIAGKKWFAPEKLYNKVVEQQHWNPFSIFGSSIPYVSLNQVFNVESSGNYVVGSVKQGVLNRIQNYNGNGITGSVDSKVDGSRDKGKVENELGVDNNVSIENSTNMMMINYLKKKWTRESKKAINWNLDPLLNVEVLWYINSTGKYLDRSRDVCILQKCFCTTPDPNVRFNWNDPRYLRDSPRGSMGFLLDSREYNTGYSRYKELRERLNMYDDCSTKMASDGLEKKKNVSDENSGTTRTNNKRKRVEGEEEIKLTYYANYFRYNSPP